MTADPGRPSGARARAWRSELRRRRPPFAAAVAADARASGRPPAALLADPAFLALAVYRARSRLHALGVPVLPRLLHRLSIALGRLYVGDPVVIDAGVRVPEGRAVVDGLSSVGPGTTIGPRTTIGLRAGDLHGPTIGAGVEIGAGARVVGAVTVGDGAGIAPGSVVVDDVAPGTHVAGLPARRGGGAADAGPTSPEPGDG